MKQGLASYDPAAKFGPLPAFVKSFIGAQPCPPICIKVQQLEDNSGPRNAVHSRLSVGLHPLFPQGS